MTKIKRAWFCSSCGNESAKWVGRCNSCGEWNSMVEEVVSRGSSSKGGGHPLLSNLNPKPEPLSEITSTNEERISLGNGELDRLLGGGLVAGSLILIGGEPGIGKSTLSLQIPLNNPSLKTLYISGEESPKQIKLRGERLGGDDSNCYILPETVLENIITRAKESEPHLIIVDSIQTIYSLSLESSPGSISQIRESAALLLKYAKESNTPIILIGHITKEGSIAGPKVLEHIVDVVLQFEGDNRHSYRVLRGIKNRFGSTAELAIFEMVSSGLREVSNPSELLTPMHGENLSGIAVAATIDGSRPLLIETQALVSSAAYGTPQRSSTGFDSKRANMLLAVLERRAGFKLGSKDLFLNMAGGLKVTDPGCDLAVLSAILSSNFDLPISQRYAFAAEVGLSGEIRSVAQIERRISEAQKLGYQKIFISAYSRVSSPKGVTKGDGIEIVKVEEVPHLVKLLFS